MEITFRIHLLAFLCSLKYLSCIYKGYKLIKIDFFYSIVKKLLQKKGDIVCLLYLLLFAFYDFLCLVVPLQTEPSLNVLLFVSNLLL